MKRTQHLSNGASSSRLVEVKSSHFSDSFSEGNRKRKIALGTPVLSIIKFKGTGMQERNWGGNHLSLFFKFNLISADAEEGIMEIQGRPTSSLSVD